MHQVKYGASSITVGAVELLLASAGGGTAVHLVPVAADGVVGQSAVADDCFTGASAGRRPGLANYDHDALLAPRWAQTTLCGRGWAVMVGGDGGSISPSEDPEFAPTCKRCLALLDRMFPPPPAHPRLPLIVRVVADCIAEHGYAELHDVPGDQQTQLRRQIRSLVRRETGHSCQTLVHESLVVIMCEPIAELHREERLRDAAQRMSDWCSGEATASRPDPEWRLFWSTWATD
jgi:hypothetical protein